MSETHWKRLINPDYLGAYSLEYGEDMILTISAVKREMITGTGGKKEECPVCHWQENQKPMILNVTNMKAIAKMYGPYIENWAGKRVQIYASTTKFGGDTVECLRIRKDPPEDVKIACEECGQMIAPAFSMSVTQLAAYTKKKYGKNLCAECAKSKKEEQTDAADQ
jgi:hypothetical protein